jgi:hypothetical protein
MLRIAGNSYLRCGIMDVDNVECSRVQRRGLRHELSLPIRKLGSWVRIALEAWMSVCVLPCVYVAALRRADPPSKGSYRL